MKFRFFKGWVTVDWLDQTARAWIGVYSTRTRRVWAWIAIF